MRTLDSIAELDAVIAECNHAESDDKLRTILGSFCMKPQMPEEVDPFSQQYHDAQMDLYRSISGRSYELVNESTPFDVEQAVVTPFPYSTRSCQTTGAHLVTMGEFLRHIHLPPGARVLEFGPGWGNLTLVLAAMGHHVTCVDVEPRFCELIKRRASALQLDIEVVNADFSWASQVAEAYDAIVFFECFHHAADHLGLLRSLHKALKPEGRVYLGAEPILGNFPIPWGIRLDGQSLWSVRKFGWMELGFRDDYFSEALRATGWDGIRHAVADPAIWELAKGWLPRIYRGDDPRLGSVTGSVVGSRLVFDGAPKGPALFGPYIDLRPGSFAARVHFSPEHPMVGRVVFDVCAQGASEVFARQVIEASRAGPAVEVLELRFSLSSRRTDLEVRLIGEEGLCAWIESVEIVGNSP